jgi:hypothetical protein
MTLQQRHESRDAIEHNALLRRLQELDHGTPARELRDGVLQPRHQLCRIVERRRIQQGAHFPADMRVQPGDGRELRPVRHLVQRHPHPEVRRQHAEAALGLDDVRGDQYEAAKVDGAGDWAIFRRITFPSILPLFMILLFLSAIWDFKVFTQIWTVRQGGPAGETVTLSIYTYLKGIAGAQYGVASAAAVVMVLILLFVLVPYIRRLLRQQEAVA